MTKLEQDFTVYAGDAALIAIVVEDDDEVAIDISTVTQISWYVRRNLDSAVILTKTKTGGGIAFTSSGTDGSFQITLSGTDTSALTGNYLHQATITDSTGKITTVALGQMDVGIAPVWTYSGDPSTSTKDAVRFLVGDIIKGDPQLQDGEINYSYTTKGNVWGAAAMCCRALASQFSRQADSVQGELRTLYSARSKAYSLRAHEYEDREALLSGGADSAYAGGISIADKEARRTDTDRVLPNFVRGIMDNHLPVTGTDEADS